MAQRLGEWGLRKKFSINKLSKVGSVYFKGNVAKPGVQRGTVLKNTLIGIGKGKMSKYQLERALKLSGVAGSQLGKRNKILDLVYGNEKKDMVIKTDSKKVIKTNDGKSYLTEAQVKRNLKVNMQRDESGLGLDRKRYKASFSDNVVSTKSVAVAEAQKEIGAGRIGINTGPVGFIGGQPGQGKKDKAVNFNATSKLPNNSLPKITPGGVRPMGL